MSFPRVRAWLARHTDLEPSLLRGETVERLIRGRPECEASSAESDYVELLETDAREREALIAEVAVPESRLFRYPESFRLLVEQLGRRRQVDDAGPPLRMLSVGCARGQEPCSMVIAALHAAWPPARIAVDAVDIHGGNIEHARRGRYDASVLAKETERTIPPWAGPWLSVGDEVVIDTEVLGPITYHHDDALTIDLPPGVFGVIFCRNLLIYLNPEARRRLVSKLLTWLRPDGLLFVGHAESSVLAERFVPLPTRHAFALQRRVVEPGSSPRVSPRPGATPTPVKASRRFADGSAPPVARTPAAAPAEYSTSPDDARSLADAGRLAEAEHAALAELRANGPDVDVLTLLGSLQMGQNRLDDARDSFRKAIYLAPDHEDALLPLALVCERLGDTANARRYRRRAARAHDRTSSEQDGDE